MKKFDLIWSPDHQSAVVKHFYMHVHPVKKGLSQLSKYTIEVCIVSNTVNINIISEGMCVL